MAKQTREEYYNQCKAAGEPLPEIVRAGDVAFTDAMGNKTLVRDADVNATDWREIDADGNAGPWQKANA